ncbi:MAG: GNAT family N-acetyltransferase [Panacagrimonas sp.]
MGQVRHISRLTQVDAAAWDALFDSGYPFTRHAWLSRLESHGCVSEKTGWEPFHVLMESEAGALVGAAPLYLKHHSYGEFVFDFAWADASRRIGKPYYPKLLNAIPFVPSTGPRLGASDDAVRTKLAQHLVQLPEAQRLSSLHTLFADSVDSAALRAQGLIERHDIQFRWTDQNFGDMASFIASLTSEKRKKLLRERRRVAEAGIGFEVVRGAELVDSDWDGVYRLYANTYLERGQSPYFTRDFLADVGRCPDLDVRLIFAVHEKRKVALAITLVGGDTLYGRHWGSEAHYHSLHFECCYYQGIELCLREGLAHFDAGTQGAHKHGRGFLPVQTRSFHHLRDPRLRRAVQDYLAHERSAVSAQQTEFMHHTAYRSEPSEPAGNSG